MERTRQEKSGAPAREPERSWHSREALQALESGREAGLPGEEAARRRERYGPNQLTRRGPGCQGSCRSLVSCYYKSQGDRSRIWPDIPKSGVRPW
ncbi:cation-transporting P-type ATPase [Thiohalorhabdus methylotrophus]|uniref:Cation-transporting P-type ATPase n=1 Tax=Thiohalorhabdus methylotrophus TaxID=3242694 RepID=A0ABV4TVB8_9GAMM